MYIFFIFVCGVENKCVMARPNKNSLDFCFSKILDVQDSRGSNDLLKYCIICSLY